MKCKAMTLKGLRCKNNRSSGCGDYCKVHKVTAPKQLELDLPEVQYVTNIEVARKAIRSIRAMFNSKEK